MVDGKLGGVEFRSRRAMAVWALGLLLWASPAVLALDGVPSTGGTYRFGHIHWMKQGNKVEFTVEAGFKRNQPDVSTWMGTAPDMLPKVGDVVTFPGRQPPQFYFGDGQVQQALQMTVEAYSVDEDWVMGSFTTAHEYATPNNKGDPWYAQFTGCCRYSYLKNNKDAEWVITASVDLNLANKSPRANVLPVVSVPFKPVIGPPTVYVPAEDNNNGKIEFRMGKPWEVGNAAVFKSAEKSFIAVPLSGMADRECTTSDAGSGNNFAGPGCLFRSLRTDAGQRAMTVEGWVLSAKDEGGYVMSVGSDDGYGQEGYDGPQASLVCRNAGDSYEGDCKAASIFIMVNKTHVKVGHEVVGVGPTSWVEEAFEICSNTYLEREYLCTPTKTTTNQWFHIAVVRFQHRVSGGSSTSLSDTQVSYKVLVNGRPLMVPAYPGGPPRQRAGGLPCGVDKSIACPKCITGCSAGQYCSDAGVCTACGSCFSQNEFRFACRGVSPGVCKLVPDRSCADGYCFENGESNLVRGPAAPSGNSSTADNFAKGSALLFGAYKGASRAPQYFDGALDEWRFWNGARSDSSLLVNYKTVMTLSREKFYGDPSDSSLRITSRNYLVNSVLMASWSFDQECVQSGTTGCALETVESVYPKQGDTRLPIMPGGGKQIYRAYTYRTTTGETDYQGKMFYSMADGMTIDATGKLTINTKNVGDHQVVVLMSYPGNVAAVPVDFLVKVLPAGCFQDTETGIDDCRLCEDSVMLQLPDYTCEFDKTPGVVNVLMPSIAIKASVVPAYASDVSSGNAYYVGGSDVQDIKQSLHPYYIRMFAGFELQLQLHGRDEQPKVIQDELAIYDYVFSKVGFTVGRMPKAAKFTAVHDTNPSQLDMSWTPCSADVGMHTLCFEAVDSHQQPGDKAGRPFARKAASEQRCVVIKVDQEVGPYFIVGPQDTPDTPQMCTMGKQKQIKVRVASANCQANIAVNTQQGTDLPEGASLQRKSVVVSQQGSISEGKCVTAEFQLDWTPMYTQGGFNKTVCVEATSVHSGVCRDMAPAPSRHCMHLFVQRCRYSMQMDQQLQEIAALFNVDWMRLWSLNAAILHPDYVIYGGQTVNIGHLYSALSNEMPLEIAKRMGMPEAQMRALNYGIQLGEPLKRGDQLCVIPNSCRGAAASRYSGLYLPSLSSFLGRTAADSHPIPAYQFLNHSM